MGVVVVQQLRRLYKSSQMRVKCVRESMYAYASRIGWERLVLPLHVNTSAGPVWAELHAL